MCTEYYNTIDYGYCCNGSCSTSPCNLTCPSSTGQCQGLSYPNLGCTCNYTVWDTPSCCDCSCTAYFLSETGCPPPPSPPFAPSPCVNGICNYTKTCCSGSCSAIPCATGLEQDCPCYSDSANCECCSFLQSNCTTSDQCCEPLVCGGDIYSTYCCFAPNSVGLCRYQEDCCTYNVNGSQDCCRDNTGYPINVNGVNTGTCQC